MRSNPNSKMVMSKRPSGGILITATGVERWGIPEAQICRDARACSDAVATEVVTMTDDGFRSFVARHGGKPVYPSLSAWPNPRG